MRIADLGCELENLGPGGRADPGMIGETPRNCRLGKTELVGNHLLVHLCHHCKMSSKAPIVCQIAVNFLLRRRWISSRAVRWRVN